MKQKENHVFSLLLIQRKFSKKSIKQKTKRKTSVWVKPWLNNCMYTSTFNNIFAELIEDDKEGFHRYLKNCYVSLFLFRLTE